jgi:antitoxin component YwqK of YwqJK toxin-antitoxin module
MGDQLIRWCMYKGGKPDGVAKRWHPNGHLFMTEQWKDGEKNGKEVYWRSTGIKRLSARHVNGALHGNEKLYNYDGTMTSMTTYVRGRKETQWVYDPQGNPVHFLQFIRRRFPYTTSRYTLKRYSKGGVAESIESYESGQKDGKQVELYDDGQTKAVEHFKYGIRNGLQERYYRSERLKLQYHCKRGERHGPFKAYYPSGRMKQRGGFRRGKPDGEFTTYYDQEQSHIWEFVKWKNGKQDGVSRTFYSDGSEHTRCDWVDGVQKIETLRTCGDESLYKPPPH